MAKILKPGELPANTKAPWFLAGSQVVSIDVETTGLDCNVNEIFQVGAVALDYNFEPRKDVPVFTLSMKIENIEGLDMEELAKCGINRDKLVLHTTYGMDQMEGADKFLDWVEKLELPPLRRICPLATNWPFDAGFLKAWLGPTCFESVFHPHYRDLIPAIQLINDLVYTKGQSPLHRQCNLSALCRFFNVENLKAHDALSDAMAVARIYKKMLQKFSNFQLT